MTKPQRALISVTDKTGIVEFAKSLEGLGVEILSTGGTAKALTEGGVKVKEVSEHTGFPECFGGRVKTLHPLVHGGILYDRDNQQHVEQAKTLGVKPIDIVAVNLYPFEETAKKPGVKLEDIVENVDIGGPAMLRSAFKNYKHVAVITEPSMYNAVAAEIKATGELSADTHRKLAVFAINRVADYDDAIAVELTKQLGGELTTRITGRNGKQLGRYGENWDQKAWVFELQGAKEPNVVTAKQLHGGPLGYNNYLDADAALATIMEFSEPTAVVVKHNNPCGIATADKLADALELAWQGDTVSAFGSIIAFNREVDLETVKVLTDRVGSFSPEGKPRKGYLVEVLVAPSYTSEALDYLKEKKSKESLRVLEVGDLQRPQEAFDFRAVRGGILRQTRNNNNYLTSLDDCFEKQHSVRDENSNTDRTVGVVTLEGPDLSKGLYDFAWKAAKRVKSNAIVIAREYAPGQYQLLGIGAGQPNRRDSTKIAIEHARETLALEFKVRTVPDNEIQTGFFQNSMKRFAPIHYDSSDPVGTYIKAELAKCVVASDAFFPFPDGPELLVKAGIGNFIQPGGGNKDKETIEVVNLYNGSMVFTGKRNFLH